MAILIILLLKQEYFEIETELDRYLMLKDNLDPLTSPLTNHIIINEYIVKNINPFFKTTKKQLIKSLKGMKFYDHLLVAPQLYKRGLIYLFLLNTFTYKNFQGFIVNYKPNKIIIPYILKLEILFNKSINESISGIYNLIDAIKYDHELSERFNHNFK